MLVVTYAAHWLVISRTMVMAAKLAGSKTGRGGHPAHLHRIWGLAVQRAVLQQFSGRMI